MVMLVLMRHGQSLYNAQNRFTGHLDIPLSDIGIDEAKKAKQTLKNMKFDAVFASSLSRAIQTAKIILGDDSVIPLTIESSLNERSYGDLEGRDKDEARNIFGKEQVEIWRRSFYESPPGGESLFDTYNRVIPYFKGVIEPIIKQKKNVLIVAHGNSLRALIKYLDRVSEEDIVKVEIKTGKPVVYTYDISENSYTKD